MGVMAAVDGLGRRAHVCRVPEAIRWAIGAALPLRVADERS
jgi:hypothetical protein